MTIKQARIGALLTLDDIRTAIRDLENILSELTSQAAATIDPVPANTQVVVRLSTGDYEIWDVVSTGGCTITKNAALKRIEISVP